MTPPLPPGWPDTAEKPADVQRARARLHHAWAEFNNALFEGSPTVLEEIVERLGPRHFKNLLEALEAFREGNEPRKRGRGTTLTGLTNLVEKELAAYPGPVKWSFRGGSKNAKTGKRTGATEVIPGRLTGWLYPRVKARTDALGLPFSERQLRTILRKLPRH